MIVRLYIIRVINMKEKAKTILSAVKDRNFLLVVDTNS